MREYRDVRKRLSALAVCGLLVFTTYGSDIKLIAEDQNICGEFVDKLSYDENNVLIVDEFGNPAADGYCDTCGRDYAAHLSMMDLSDAIHAHVDDDFDEICDECGVSIETQIEFIPDQSAIEVLPEEATEEIPEETVENDNTEETEEVECEHQYIYTDNGDYTHTITCEYCDYYEVAECEFTEAGWCYYCGANIEEESDEDPNELIDHQIIDEVYGVIVRGWMPREATITVDKISVEVAESIINENYDENFKVYEAYDVNIYDAYGNIYQPVDDGNTVEIIVPNIDGLDEVESDEVQALRIEDDLETVTELNTTDVEGETASFESEHFTIVVVGAHQETAVTNSKTITYPSFAFIGTAGSETSYTQLNKAEFEMYFKNEDTVTVVVDVYKGFTDDYNPTSGIKIGTCSETKKQSGKVKYSISFSSDNTDIYIKSGDMYAVVVTVVNNYYPDIIVSNGSSNGNYVSSDGISFYKNEAFPAMISIETTAVTEVNDITQIEIESAGLNREIANDGSEDNVYYLVGEADTFNAVLTPAYDRLVEWDIINQKNEVKRTVDGVVTAETAAIATLQAKVNKTLGSLKINFLDAELAEKSSDTYTSDYRVYYNGKEQKPLVQLKNADGNTETLTQNNVVAAAGADNVNAGTGKISIPYTVGSVTYHFIKEFTIEKKPIDESNFSNAVFVVDTNANTVEAVEGVTSGIDNVELVYGKDYTVVLGDSIPSKNGVSYNKVTIEIIGDNYSGGKFDITSNLKFKAQNTISILAYYDIRWENGIAPQYVYTGSPVVISAEDWNDSSKLVIRKSVNGSWENITNTAERNEFNISYGEDSEHTNAGGCIATISMDNYSGTFELPFEIIPIDIEDQNNSEKVEITLEQNSYAHTGQQIKPEPTVKYNGKTLIKDVDYSVSYLNNQNIGTATVIVTGNQNYTGTKNVNFEIAADFNNDLQIKVTGVSNVTATKYNNYSTGYTVGYTGASIDIASKLTVYISTINNGKKSLVKDTDYTVTCVDKDDTKLTADAGTKEAVIRGKEGTIYEGCEVRATYIVTKINIAESGTITLAWNQGSKNYSSTDRTIAYAYTGKEISIEKNDYIFKCSNNEVTDGNYTISYDGDHKNNGKQTVTFNGVNNFTGKLQLTFLIKPVQLTADMITFTPATGTYSGSKLEPQVKVLYNGIYASSSDYSVDYGSTTNLISVGDHPINVTGTGNFTGTVTKKYTIESKKINTLSITIDGNAIMKVDSTYNYCPGFSPKYTGWRQTGNVVVKDGTYTLINGKDYKLEYFNNENVSDVEELNAAGELNQAAHIKITGLNNYAGNSEIVYFDITRRKIPSTITYTKNVAYISDTTVHRPIDIEIIETSSDLPGGSYKLVENIDYEISIAADTDATASGNGKKYIITGKGNYEGTIEKEYEIGTNLAALTTNQMTLTNPISNETYVANVNVYTVPYIGNNPYIFALNGLTEHVDYEIEYTSEKDDTYNSYNGTNIVTVKCIGKGACYGTRTVYYKIQPIDLAKISSKDKENNQYYIDIVDVRYKLSGYADAADRTAKFLKYHYTGKKIDVSDQIEFVYGYKNETSEIEIETLKKPSQDDRDYVMTSTISNTSAEIGPEKATYHVLSKVAIGSKYGNYVGTSPSIGVVIDQAPINNTTATITVNPSSKILKKYEGQNKYYAYYTGERLKLSGSDLQVKIGDTELVYGTDFYINFINGEDNGSTNGIAVKEDTVAYIVGQNNYNDVAKFYFDIIAIDATKDEGFVATINHSYAYNDSQIIPGQTAGYENDLVVTYNNNVLTKGTDYVIKTYGANREPGRENFVTIEGKGKYAGEKKVYFEIYLDLADKEFSKVSLTKNGAVVDTSSGYFDLDADGNANVAVKIQYKMGGTYKTLTDPSNGDKNYIMTVTNDGNPGLHEITVEGLDNGESNCCRNSTTFNNVKFLADLGTGIAAGSKSNVGKYAAIDKAIYEYLGENISVNPNIKLLYGKIGEDIEVVSQSDDTKVGEKQIVLRATRDNYYRIGTTITLTYNIKYNLDTAIIYTRVGSEDTSSVAYRGSEFVLGTDINVLAKFGNDAAKSIIGTGGYVSAVSNYPIQDVNNYTITLTVEPTMADKVMGGPVILSFDVVGKKFEHLKASASLNQNVFDYTGKEITPKETVVDDSYTLVRNKDYTVSYENNVNAGTAKVILTGKGAYANNEQIELTFTINKKIFSESSKDLNVLIDPVYYAGDQQPVQPVITLQYGTYNLVEGTDYKITNKQNDWKLYAGTSGDTLTGTIEFIGNNFSGTRPLEFTVQKLDVNSASVTVSEDSADYTGKEITLTDLKTKFKIKVGDVDLIQDSDYTITVLDTNGVNTTMKDMGVYYIKVDGNTTNHCTGSRTIIYTVKPRSIAKNWYKNGSDGEITIKVEDVETYKEGDTAIPSKITIEDKGVLLAKDETTKKLIEGVDYTIVSYQNNTAAAAGEYDEDAPTDQYGNLVPKQGSPYVVIKGMGNYAEEEVKVVFNIGKDINTLEGVQVTLSGFESDNRFYYNGIEQIPEVDITYNNKANRLRSFYIEVEDVSDTATPIPGDATNAGTKNLLIKGTGSYYGTLYKNKNATAVAEKYYQYQIYKRDIKNAYSYKTDYVDESKNDAVIKTQDQTLQFSVNLPKLTTEIIEALPNKSLYEGYEGYYYALYDDGNSEPEITVSDLGLKCADKTLVKGKDYNISYERAETSSNTLSSYISFAKITFTKDGNYEENPSVVFKVYYIIAQTNLNTSYKVQFDKSERVYAWTGLPVMPDIKVKNKNDTILKESKDGRTGDYTVEWKNNVAPGEASVIISGINNYTGITEETFTIRADLTDSKCKIVTPYENVVFDANDEDTYRITDKELPKQLYTGKEIKPIFRVILFDGNGTDKNLELVEGVDFTSQVASSNGYKDGSIGEVTLTGIGPYFGETKKATFNIEFDESLISLKGDQGKYYYTGADIIPEFKPSTPDGTILEYKVIKNKRNNAETTDLASLGKITSTIEVYLAEASVEKEVAYEIVARPMSQCIINYNDSARYTGSAITPSVSVYVSSSAGLKRLDSGDYTVDYSQNINPGVGTIHVTAVNSNFTGEDFKNFTIAAGRPASVNVIATSNTTIRASWVRDIFASGTRLRLYKVDSSGNATFVREELTKSTTFDFTGLDSAAKYRIEFRSYIDSDKDGYPDSFSEEVYGEATTGLAGTVLTLTSPSTGKTRLSWSNSGTVSAYMIYRKALDGDYQKVATLPSSTLAYTDSSLESGTTYYYYVRGYSYVGGQKVYSDPSDPVSVVVK